VFHAQSIVERARLPAECAAFPASDLPARHAERPYDLVIYQLGNSLEHAFVYDLLPRLPGLVVLHDLVLHHSRARMFLESPEALAYAADPSRADLRDTALARLDGYRAELACTYPAQAERLYAAQLDSVGTLLPYAYPLARLPLEAARGVAVHNEFMAAAVRAEVPGTPVVRVPMPVTAAPVDPAAVAALRARHGLAPDDVVGAFGLLTPEKRIDTVARAVARASAALPRLKLLLVGPLPAAAQGCDARDAFVARLSELGVGERAIVTGRVALAELPAYMAEADVAVHLRYPTGRETSAALLRLLAQGRPVVMSDLEHQADVPEGAVVRVDPSDEEGDVLRAILRLAERPELRASLGRNAAAFAAREHAPQRAREGYVAAIEAALRRPPPAPRPDWPAHWREAAS
jgi:glycosyltransferase involved in cell wall biosynthesis